MFPHNKFFFSCQYQLLEKVKLSRQGFVLWSKAKQVWALELQSLAKIALPHLQERPQSQSILTLKARNDENEEESI